MGDGARFLIDRHRAGGEDDGITSTAAADWLRARPSLTGTALPLDADAFGDDPVALGRTIGFLTESQESRLATAVVFAFDLDLDL